MKQTIFHEIPRGILATLLDREGQYGVLSPRPLMGEACSVNKHQLAELYAGNFVLLPGGDNIVVTPEFAQAARVLLNPATQITFRIWSDEDTCAETSVLFPGDIVDAGGVILNQIDSAYRIVSQVNLDDVIGLVGPTIPSVDNRETAFDFECNFDIPVAAVLFGLIDMIRLHVETGNGRQDSGYSCFTPLQVSAFLNGWWGLTGFKHLTSYITAAGIMPDPPALNEVEYGLEVLAEARIVEKAEPGEVTLTQTMVPLVDLLPERIPGLQWQRTSLTDEEEILATNRIFVFGKDSLVLSFSPMPERKIHITTMSAMYLTEFLLKELTTVLSRETQQTQTESVSSADNSIRTGNCCDVCGHELERRGEFCPRCGAVHCPHCNSYVKRGKFCRRCGERL